MTEKKSNVIDWRGTPIEIGSKVVYPSRAGSELWMNEGEVVEVRKMKDVEGRSCEVISILRPDTTRRSYPDRDRITVVA